MPSGEADRAGYLAAIEEGPEACAAIAAPALAGECMAFAASSRAQTDPQGAQAICAAISDPVWADECGFLVCDAVGVSVTEARTCCAAAGRYSERCIGHAVSRAAYAVLEDVGPGGEQRAWDATLDVCVQALGTGGSDRAADLYVKWLLDRVEGPALRAEHCGTAPRDLCADVYAELVARRAREEGVEPERFARRACAKVVTRARAVSLGLPGWEPQVDGAVQAAFKRMCRR